MRPATEEEIERAEEQGLSEEGEAVLEDDEEEAEEDEAEDDGDFEDNSDEPSKRKGTTQRVDLFDYMDPYLGFKRSELVGRAPSAVRAARQRSKLNLRLSHFLIPAEDARGRRGRGLTRGQLVVCEPPRSRCASTTRSSSRSQALALVSSARPAS